MFVSHFDQLFDCFVSLMVLEITLSIQSSECENTPERSTQSILKQNRSFPLNPQVDACDQEQTNK